MSLPPLSALAWTPRCRTGMVTDDEDDFGAPGPPAPALAPMPPRLLTERQREAVYQYIRGEVYEQYEWYLDDQYPGTFAEAHEKSAYREMMKEWEAKDRRRKVDFDNSDAFSVWTGTVEEVFHEAAYVIASASREAVKNWDQDLYAHFDPNEAADHFDGFSRTAAAMVEDHMRERSAGFFDEATDRHARDAIADQLNFEMDPN